MKQHLNAIKLNPLIILFVLALFFCGCSSTYTVRSTEAEDAFSYEQMNEKLTGQNATIELRDGREMYAKEIQIANDSVSGVDVRTDVKAKASIVQLDKIIIKDRARGVLEGLLLGGMPGLFLIVSGIDVSGSGVFFISGIFGGFLILGGIYLITIGLISGVLAGHSDIYEFPIEQPSDPLLKGNSPQK